jgi:uncharacterized membrane protein YoaT (DUF817 family)
MMLPKLFLYSSKNSYINYILELISFGWHSAWSCLFPVFIFGILAVSNVFPVPGLPRYDFILIACILMQLMMYWSKLETRDELIVITMFHMLGLLMEVYKVHKGSWVYPEGAYSKFWDVPVYSGFMYASVASYICQAWRRLDLKFLNWPNRKLVVILGIGIYLNFFTHHYLFDFRWVLTGAIFIVFYKTEVAFTPLTIQRKMPMALSFFLIGLFIWLAENIATFLGAWKYAYQHKSWQMVGVGKLSSWGLLVIVSIIIVAELKFIKSKSDHPIR